MLSQSQIGRAQIPGLSPTSSLYGLERVKEHPPSFGSFWWGGGGCFLPLGILTLYRDKIHNRKGTCHEHSSLNLEHPVSLPVK